MGLRDLFQYLLCKLGIHNWNRPKQPDTDIELETPRVCKNCGTVEKS